MPSLGQAYGYVFRKLLEAPVVVGYSTGADECYFHCINKLIVISVKNTAVTKE